MRATPLCVAAMLVAGVGLSGCEGQTAQGAPPPPQVTAANPLQETVIDWDDFSGRFEASQRIEVRARAGGYLQAAHFREGQLVKQGQLLFTLDPRPAQAQLAAAKAQADLARGDMARAEALLKEQAISREEYDSRRAAYLVAQSAVRSRALDLEFTRVVAPASGVVSNRRVDPGNVIAGGSSTSDVLTTIVSTNPIYFYFDASEAQLLKQQRQGRGGAAVVKLRLQDEPDYRWEGRVDFSDNVVDDATGAMRMRARIDNASGFLKPGMFGAARVEGSTPYAALLVPATALANDGARKVVYVVSADGKVTMQPVQIGPLSGDMRVIRAGLKASDKVIVGGAQRAQPGQPVQVKMTKITRGTAAATPAPMGSVAPASAATPVGA